MVRLTLKNKGRPAVSNEGVNELHQSQGCTSVPPERLTSRLPVRCLTAALSQFASRHHAAKMPLILIFT